MNTFQKVVKYIALALALSIIVFIITLAFNIINEVFLSIHEESTQKVEYKLQMKLLIEWTLILRVLTLVSFMEVNLK